MDLREIEKQAKSLMTAHGVGYLRFEFDRGKRRIGATHMLVLNKGTKQENKIPQRITFSRHYADLLTPDEIRDVILHEIAHALAPNAGHGALWKAAARRIGAKPERCKATTASPTAAVTADCPECPGVAKGSQHRLPTALYVCSIHRNRALRWYRNGARVMPNDMPEKYRQRYNAAMMRGVIR